MTVVKKKVGLNSDVLSPQGKLDISDLWGFLRTALVVAVIAGLDWIVANITSFDFGTLTPLIVAGLLLVVDAIRRVLSGDDEQPTPPV